MNEYVKVTAARSPAVGGIEFHIVERQPTYDGFRVGHVVMEEKVDEAVWYPPAFWLTEHNAQKLMDDLWNAGIKPSDYGDAEGALKSTKDHLQDMRRIAFRFLERPDLEHSSSQAIDE